MVRKGLPILTLLLTLVAAGCAFTGGLQIRESWARPALAGDNGAAYFIIENNTRKEEMLTGVTGDIAASIEMHMSSSDASGVVQMKPQSAVQIPGSSTVEFKPGGYHIMLMNLKKDLKPGDTFELTLQFSGSGAKTIQVEVKNQ